MGRHRRLREPRHHWVLVCLLLGTFLCVLAIHGYADAARDPKAPATRGSPAGKPVIADNRPVVDLAGRTPVGVGAPARTIALTFEDGPDPRWTPRLLDVLRRHDAHATFFMVGSEVADHPKLARRVVDEGHEVGSHTYSHVDLGRVSGWRGKFELTLTRNILAGVTGQRVGLLRPPYSSVPSALGGGAYDAARAASRDGYLVVLADRDTRDLSGRKTSQVVAAATPPSGRGSVVLLHDAGGDRTAVVEGVDRLLTRLERKGYRFTTVSDALGRPASATQASLPERLAGLAWVAAQRTGGAVTTGLTYALGIVAVLTMGRLLVLLLLAWLHAFRSRRARVRNLRTRARAARAQARALRAEARAVRSRSRRAHSRADRAWTHARKLTATTSYCPPVSIIVPAHNEAAGIAATVRSLWQTSYRGDVEIIVVDDGSTDGTAEIAANLNLLDVVVLSQPNAGKPAALNTGIAHSRHGILVLVDADTVFEPDAIGRLVEPFADPMVGAVSGNTKVGNARSTLGRWQHIEYVIGFNLDRRMFDLLRCMPTVPGAIGAFRWEALASVGWVSADTLAEDTDLTMAICRAGWRVTYEAEALAWTEAPSSLTQLWRQRYRWCYGTMQAMWKHRRTLVERGPAGMIGRRGLTYLALYQVVLPLLAPAVDLYALYGLAFGDAWRVFGVWAVFVVMQALAGAYALRLDDEPLTPLWTLPLQQLVYRLLMYLVVTQSLVTAIMGTPLGWHTSHREGTFRPDQNRRPAEVAGTRR